MMNEIFQDNFTFMGNHTEDTESRLVISPDETDLYKLYAVSLTNLITLL